MSIVFKGKKGAGTITVESGSAVVGTRSTCALVLEDPMAAERHCAFHQEGSRWFVEDLKNSSGTYLAGLPVEGRAEIHPGAEVSIVAGVSRLLATADAEKGVLTINVKEASFFYDKKEDPYEWVKSEVGFGRFPPVRIGNLAAAALVGVVFAASFVDPVADPVLEPGPLAAVHARAVAEKGEGCNACHEPLRGTPPSKCGPCHHAHIVQPAVHPFSWEDGSCQPCHPDHIGPEKTDLYAMTSPETCDDCHERGRKLDRRRAAPEVQEKWVTLAYDTFPHAAHFGEKARALGMECKTCHRPAAADAIQPADVAAGTPRREFARIAFEECQECHGPGGKAGTGWAVAWHGTDGKPEGDTKCLTCHAQVADPALRTVARAAGSGLAPRFQWTFKARDHQEQVAGHPKGDPKACVDCHRDAKAGGTFDLAARPFAHATHLTALAPAGAEAGIVDGECRLCHTEQEKAEARSLAVPHFQGAEGDCSKCHTGGLPPPVKPPPPAELVAVPDFPHALHVKSTDPDLAGGCLKCHAPPAGILDASVPGTDAAARSCKPCHETHRNVGGGHCDRCHAAGDPVYARKRINRPWPAPNRFSHRSRGHADVRCDECHKNTDQAKTLSQVIIPAETDDSCRACHIEKEARFHWK